LTRYLLRVYSGAGYHPDRTLQSLSRRRVERRAKRYESEGFDIKLLAVSTSHAMHSFVYEADQKQQRV
jgi:hypothetical protein